MPKFKIMTPVPDWTGSVGETGNATSFVDGKAELDVVDERTAGRLSYFLSAGYRIDPLDDISPADAIRSATLTPAAETEVLERENAALKKAASLEGLRKENAKLREDAARAADDAERARVKDETVDLRDDSPRPAPTRQAQGQKGGQR